MPNMLQQGSAMLHRIRHEKVSESVEYRRRTLAMTLSATVGFTRHEKTDDAGAATLVRTTDFIFRTSDLDLQDPPEPAQGDVIARTVNGQTRLFSVVQAGNEGCYRREGLAEEATRVHTVETGVEP